MWGGEKQQKTGLSEVEETRILVLFHGLTGKAGERTVLFCVLLLSTTVDQELF